MTGCRRFLEEAIIPLKLTGPLMFTLEALRTAKWRLLRVATFIGNKLLFTSYTCRYF
ncbi:hypothetical protein LCGC14_1383100 [marine sediment metagenome]|uniref:Uncharacterized protein n=1 Tax=marine sediment metagenome TaxID=412755 RepID=A0A0F9K239_9ZZZZ